MVTITALADQIIDAIYNQRKAAITQGKKIVEIGAGKFQKAVYENSGSSTFKAEVAEVAKAKNYNENEVPFTNSNLLEIAAMTDVSYKHLLQLRSVKHAHCFHLSKTDKSGKFEKYKDENNPQAFCAGELSCEIKVCN